MSKIETRIKQLCFGLNKRYVDPTNVAIAVVGSSFDGITTKELDGLAAETAASLSTEHPDYGLLAGRIVASSIQKSAPETFLGAMQILHDHKNPDTKESDPLIATEVLEFAQKHRDIDKEIIRRDNDYTYDYFAIKTLERSYLQKIGNITIETPQYMLMRVSIGIHGFDKENVVRTYNMLSEGLFTHATPTLYNAGTVRPQMISCLTGEITDDSMTGIYKTLHDVAMLSKHGAGIGVSIDKVRSAGMPIRGGGTSDGIVPMLRVFNATARYSNQLGKRKGSFAMYLNPAHPDMLNFLELKKNTGSEEERTRDLFLAVWAPDIFFERVRDNGTWTFFDPSNHKGLYDLYGDEFSAEYCNLEAMGHGSSKIEARELWARIISSQIETGVPYILARDRFNHVNMQSNMGSIKTSNLCVSGDTKILTRDGDVRIDSVAWKDVEVWNGHEFSNVRVEQTGAKQEMMEVTFSNGNKLKCTPYHKFYINQDDTETMVQCNELHVGDNIIPFLKPDGKITVVSVTSISKADKADTYCFKEPLRGKGIFNGILTGQCAEIGLYTAPDEWGNCVLSSIAINKFYNADIQKYDYKSLMEVTKQIVTNLNRCIDRNYYAIPEAKKGALNQRALGIGIQGAADLFATMKVPFGSEQADIIQQNIMESIYYAAIEQSNKLALEEGSYPRFEGSPWQNGILHIDGWEPVHPLKHDWERIRAIAKTGMKNSLLTALMPTASTSQILGNNECFEAFTSNMFVRRTLSGEFVVVNKHLIKDLCEINLWGKQMNDRIVQNSGSIQGINEIPEAIRERYLTIWEIPQKTIISMARSRTPFVDQSQSMNLWFASPNFNTISNAIMYGWKVGLKTLNYYIRTKPVATSQKFTVSSNTTTFEYEYTDNATSEAVSCSLDNPENCDSCSG